MQGFFGIKIDGIYKLKEHRALPSVLVAYGAQEIRDLKAHHRRHFLRRARAIALHDPFGARWCGERSVKARVGCGLRAIKRMGDDFAWAKLLATDALAAVKPGTRSAHAIISHLFEGTLTFEFASGVMFHSDLAFNGGHGVVFDLDEDRIETYRAVRDGEEAKGPFARPPEDRMEPCHQATRLPMDEAFDKLHGLEAPGAENPFQDDSFPLTGHEWIEAMGLMERHMPAPWSPETAARLQAPIGQ